MWLAENKQTHVLMSAPGIYLFFTWLISSVFICNYFWQKVRQNSHSSEVGSTGTHQPNKQCYQGQSEPRRYFNEPYLKFSASTVHGLHLDHWCLLPFLLLASGVLCCSPQDMWFLNFSQILTAADSFPCP